MDDVELLQFHYSHFNEKVRWALDGKGIAHRRTTLLPGPHALTLLPLTGATETPVLRVRLGSGSGETRTIAGSAEILLALEEMQPEPPLLPEDLGDRARALELESWFDREVGPGLRRPLFDALLHTPAYIADSFSEGRGDLARTIYRTAMPLVVAVMRRSMGVTPEGIEKGLAVTHEAFDLVARESRATGYLVGDSFSIADLTAASLLAPAVMPEGSPMAMPEPRPPAVKEWLARWSSHPGAEWVRVQYRTNRQGWMARSSRAAASNDRV